MCVYLCVCLWQRFFRTYSADFNQTSPIILKCALVVRFVKSCHHHFWWCHPRKNLWSHAYCEIRRKHYWIFIKISEYLNFGTCRCCIVFGENLYSLDIQNGGPKFKYLHIFAKFLNFAPIIKQNIFLWSAWSSDSKNTFFCVLECPLPVWKILLSV